jgi:hypothetical protein
MSIAEPQSFEMTERQQLVYRSIADRDSNLADLYLCAIRLLSEQDNPDRFFLAAHAIREMTDALPKIVDLPILSKQARLGDKIRELEPIWNTALKSPCHEGGNWNGEIDGRLKQLLVRLNEFCIWWRDNFRKRREVVSNFFNKLDPSGKSLPETLERTRVKRWLELHDYFVKSAHRGNTTDDEFELRVNQLETTILDALFKKPSEDFSVIDSILAEEEGSTDA